MIVSDTTPISNFLHLGRIAVLGELFGTLHIPPAVKQEIDEGFTRDRDWLNCLELRTVVVSRPRSRLLVQRFKRNLHAGEAEAICLALERKARLCLLDDRDARTQAELNGVPLVGTLGILIEAKHAGLLGSVRQAMDFLRDHRRFWVDDATYRRVLVLADER
ncbi:MAG: hypothetical protein A3K19_08560 [Lentisphaerae bacterium RIFOXYB12_FULL_65_16]|nr:MAG: hypothetical protein A3K18_27580 [Lentisphaerae bacterium RIFOXYA12_64_32]OGV87660.1 MAG: hypothetical protein A3K19_08560 [Lentisphaerae bacterium RIFOXYB12_FULL_65_16]